MTSETVNATGQSLIATMYRHNLWANLGLCEACLALDEEQLAYSDAGAYGSIQRTLTHLVRAEERYLYHLARWETSHTSKLEERPSLTDLKERVAESGQKLIQVAASIDPDKNVQLGTGDDAELIPAKVILLQAVHHAHEHRTQIASMMGQLGIEPPHLSGWRYYDEGLP